MPCQRIALPGGGVAIVRTTGHLRAKRCKCGATAEYQCDGEVPSRSSGTCDVHICSRCRVSVGEDKDLCPAHAKAWDQAKAQRALDIT